MLAVRIAGCCFCCPMRYCGSQNANCKAYTFCAVWVCLCMCFWQCEINWIMHTTSTQWPHIYSELPRHQRHAQSNKCNRLLCAILTFKHAHTHEHFPHNYGMRTLNCTSTPELPRRRASSSLKCGQRMRLCVERVLTPKHAYRP